MADNYRDYNLTADQQAIKAKYPPLTKKYEYLDHTADVQLHAWGDTLEETFEQCAMAMFGYMTDTETVEPLDTIEVEAEGHDLLSLLYNFLNEWLYKFSADQFFVPREVKVLYIDRMRYKIRSIGRCDTCWVKLWTLVDKVTNCMYSFQCILFTEKAQKKKATRFSW
ncbi:protein archease isoform X1 [Gopherus flavomarginatus]|uniref:protein archease isoform X1 n=1 Tax=Gopherus flavomarginatus TaxID=286002 RepID=UPI0021CBB987|nr:protein archease isoform X1 [Gopherus flavomarginatus]